MQAGATHAKTEWKRKMTAGVKCKKGFAFLILYMRGSAGYFL